jgi:hypothetical protein
MAYTKFSVPSNAWVLVANNKTTASFYNVGSFPIYLTFTAVNVNPVAETVGLYLDTNGGRDKATFTNLTTVATPTYMWARSAGGKGSTLVIETN